MDGYDDAIVKMLDEVVWAMAVEGQIPLGLLAINPEQLERLKTLKESKTNDTN